MKGVVASVLAMLALAGCSQNAEPDARPDAPAPKSYFVREADLYRDPPGDICRAKDAAFLTDLIARVTDALPSGTSWTALEDFNAHGAFHGKGMEAVLRFRATIGGGAPVLMSLSGPFDAPTCQVGALAGGVGADPHDPRTIITLRVPEA